jgi:hypothetical protein
MACSTMQLLEGTRSVHFLLIMLLLYQRLFCLHEEYLIFG